HTYELRELDAAGNDFRVVGRVTLDANNPTTLTAPPTAATRPATLRAATPPSARTNQHASRSTP
ncbi:MAG: hypothetical protein AAF078_14845, partial [Planctomycetota bacterium]